MIDRDAMRLLELERVREHLHQRCATPLGQARVAAAAPLPSLEEALREARRTGEFQAILAGGRDLDLGGGGDVGPVLAALDKSGLVLAAEDLATARKLLVRTEAAVRFLSGCVEAVELRGLLRPLPSLGALEEELRRAVDDEGQVLDSASPELASIRARRRSQRERLDRALEGFVAAHPELDGPIVTVRDDRAVVAVPADLGRSTRLGIVHGRSSTGATLFVEPFALVELNNAAIELRDAEQHEVMRVLRAFTRRLAAALPELRQAADLVGDLDFVRARARLADRLGAERVEGAEDGGVTLVDARHPLLVLAAAETLSGEEARARVVPLDLALAAGETLVITGPNTGGKTVAMKTLGLAVLLFACGLPVPARRARLPLVRSLHVDIGDPQDIAQSLSTFSGHLTRIGRALGELALPALVLLDEVGAGTDPREGSALALAIVDRLRRAGATVVVTSHHEALKRYALSTPGVRSAAVEFDIDSLRPTFRLLIDRTGSSNAIAIAERLGIPGEVLADARRFLAGEESEVERLVARLEASAREHDAARDEARAEGEALRRERGQLDEREGALAARAQDLEGRERGMRARLRSEAEARLHEVVAALREEGKTLLARTADESERRKLEDKLTTRLHAARSGAARAAAAVLAEPGEGTAAAPAAAAAGPLRPGDRVRVRAFGVIGELVALSGDGAEVAVDGKRLRVRATELERLERAATPSPRVTVGLAGRDDGSQPREPTGREINLIGLTVDEALPQVERFLDQAVVAQLPEVRIIHGMGSGRLRAGVRALLRAHPNVRSTADASGGGATVAVLEL